MPFDPEINRAHPPLMKRLCVKFHDGRCKGKAMMRHKLFFSYQCIVTLTFDLGIHMAHSQLMGSLCMKFHDDRCKWKAIMQHKPFSVINAL